MQFYIFNTKFYTHRTIDTNLYVEYQKTFWTYFNYLHPISKISSALLKYLSARQFRTLKKKYLKNLILLKLIHNGYQGNKNINCYSVFFPGQTQWPASKFVVFKLKIKFKFRFDGLSKFLLCNIQRNSFKNISKW